VGCGGLLYESSDRYSTEAANLDGVPFSSTFEEENSKFVMPFSLLVIEVVVKDSDGKSPHLDDFNFDFFSKSFGIL